MLVGDAATLVNVPTALGGFGIETPAVFTAEYAPKPSSFEACILATTSEPAVNEYGAALSVARGTMQYILAMTVASVPSQRKVLEKVPSACFMAML